MFRLCGALEPPSPWARKLVQQRRSASEVLKAESGGDRRFPVSRPTAYLRGPLRDEGWKYTGTSGDPRAPERDHDHAVCPPFKRVRPKRDRATERPDRCHRNVTRPDTSNPYHHRLRFRWIERTTDSWTVKGSGSPHDLGGPWAATEVWESC